ncbi:hypothetical protein GCM10009665_71520 [Kitasatospora nipponensis]|uniref:Uncharacterized protein n=1 Tax=Kitasatospora nipponensis TaxID=258049 RepID=A0ABN1WZ33_9ACTN
MHQVGNASALPVNLPTRTAPLIVVVPYDLHRMPPGVIPLVAVLLALWLSRALTGAGAVDADQPGAGAARASRPRHPPPIAKYGSIQPAHPRHAVDRPP